MFMLEEDLLRLRINGIVMVYSLATGSWKTLPPSETMWFGMAAVNNQLVLVGGNTKPYNEVTGILAVWDERSRTWTRPFPEMPTPRHSPSVVSYQKWLVVAGGLEASGYHSDKVEILDTLLKQWYEGSPLRDGSAEMSSTINGNMWYLSRGFISNFQQNLSVFSVCLDELISQAQTDIQSATATPRSTPSLWQMLTDTPLTNSTILVLNGALLTVGGDGSSAIHHYQPSSKSWVKVGDLPIERVQCACTVLPTGEIFVVGGHTRIDGMADIPVHVDLGDLI